MAKKVVMYGDGGVSTEVRIVLPSIAIDRISGSEDCTVKDEVGDVTVYADATSAVFSRTINISALQYYKKRGIHTVVDIDDAFHLIPEAHPGYHEVGPGNPIYISRMEECLRAADIVTVTTKRLQDYARDLNENVVIIPNGWSKDTPHWSTRESDPAYITLGFSGTITHREDFLMCFEAAERVLREHPNIRIAIFGDGEIYRMFNSIPERQKMFTPFVPYGTFPYSIRKVDIHLAPLELIPFNHAKSDIRLVQAGAKKATWIASPTEPYLDWSAGGLIASSQKQWYDSIVVLAQQKEIRDRLSEEGYEKALTREMESLGHLWDEVTR